MLCATAMTRPSSCITARQDIRSYSIPRWGESVSHAACSIDSHLSSFMTAMILGSVSASLAVYFARGVVAGRRATFTSPFVIILVGPILVALVGFTTAFIFSSISPLIGLSLALLAWLWLVKSMYEVDWLAAKGVYFGCIHCSSYCLPRFWWG